MPDEMQLTAQTLYPQFFRLAAVNILSNLMVPLAGLADTAFLGHLTEIRHLAGVTLATVLFNYIYWTFGFLRMGTTGTTAQALGRGDRQTVLLILLRHSAIALGIGLLILILQEPLRQIGFALLSATAAVKAAGQSYYQALIWGAPATLLNFVLVGWFLGLAQSKRVLLLSVISNGSNVALNYLLIVRWGWASTGAGAATALSQYLMLGVGLMLILRDRPWQGQANLRAQLFDSAALRATLVLNRDILIRTFALISTFALFTNLSAALGTLVLATNALLLQIVTLAAYFIDGLAFATESLVGILKGQALHTQVWKLLQLAIAISLSVGVGIALLFMSFSQTLFGLLTDHTPVLSQINLYARWLLPVLGLGSIAYLLDGYFLGLTQGQVLRQSSLIAALLGFGPLAGLAWGVRSSHLLWLALCSFMAARALTLGSKVPASLSSSGKED